MKKTIRSILTAAALVLTMLLSAACGAQTDQTNEPSKTETSGKTVVKIGLAQNQSDTSMNAQKVAFEAYCDKFNETNDEFEVKYYVVNAESDVQKQIDDVNSLIELGCSAISLHSVDTEGLKVAIDACKTAGVYTIEARGMDYDAIDLKYNACDENQIGETSFEWISKNIMDPDDSKVLKIGVIYGAASMTEQMKRVDKLVELLKDNYGEDRVMVVDSQYCEWDAQKSMEITENWLQRFTFNEMNCIFNAYGDGLCADIQAIINYAGEDAAKEYLLCTTDANQNTCYYLNEGYIDMSVGLNNKGSGNIQAELLIQQATGVVGPHNYDLSKGSLVLGVESGAIVPVTKETVLDWYNPETGEITEPEI